jgi:hypothetical protein
MSRIVTVKNIAMIICCHNSTTYYPTSNACTLCVKHTHILVIMLRDVHTNQSTSDQTQNVYALTNGNISMDLCLTNYNVQPR